MSTVQIHGSRPRENISNLYEWVLGAIAWSLGGALPFAYFYERLPRSRRASLSGVWLACKSTVAFVLATLIFLMIGLIFRPGQMRIPNLGAFERTHEWIVEVLDTSHAGVSALLFLVGLLSSVGLVGWISFTAYGLFALPFMLLRGRQSLESERLDVETELLKLRSEMRRSGGRSEMTSSMAKREYALQGIQACPLSAAGEAAPCFKVCIMGEGFCGSVCVCVLPLHDCPLDDIYIRSCVSSVNMFKNIYIKFSARAVYLGALVRKPRLCLIRLIGAFFAYQRTFLCVCVCVCHALVCDGLDAVWAFDQRRALRMPVADAVRARETSSIGAIIMTAIVIFISLANTVQLPTLAPNYVGFGSHATECEGPGAVAQRCDRSRISAMLIRMTTGFEIFSHVFYASSWLFGLTALWSAAYAGCCAKKQANLRVESFEDEPTDHLDSNEGQVLMVCV